jgi:hypothetical protein
MLKGHLRVKGQGYALLICSVLGVLAAGCSGWKGVSLSAEESALVSPNGAITQAGDEARTGWYPDQPGLDPAIVGGPNFGRLFKTPLPLTPGEQVLAQPLVYNGKVLVVTEANNLYLLDAVTGAITNQRALGAAYNASGGLGCGDITPTVGITGTPVIDTSSGTAYFYSKSAAGVWTFHAIDATNLNARAGFPITLTGNAQNDPSYAFNPATHHQRPGLLLMDGVVYAGFGAHCDIGEYRGWIVGVSTTGVIKAMFATVQGTGANGRGAGVWQSGGGLMSDGAGQIVFSTGNGYNGSIYPNPIPTNTDPGPLVEAIARVTVQANGTLKTTDAFIPYNYSSLDGGDADLGSGGVVALPSQFGTASVPRLAMVSGKGGTFYLLNRDHLGGHKQGPAGGDAVLAAVDLGGSTWTRPAAWPGDGGYMYVMTNGGTSTTGFRLQVLKYGTNAQGLPTAAIVGRAPENFGSYSGSAIVTSNGTASGSALVWATNNTSALRVYDAVPVNGNLTLRYQDAYGNQAKFTTLGVGAGRVYVGSGDGYVVGYGSTALPPVSGGPVDYGTVIIGQNKPLNVTLTANQNMTVTGFSTTNGVYTVGASTPALPAAMTAGQTMTVPVTFTPTVAGTAAANLTVATSSGNALVTLTGVGQVNGPKLVATPGTLTFGGVATGTAKPLSVVLQNTGNQTLTFAGSTGPAAPFSATGVPANGVTLAAGASVTATVTFAPTTDGTWGSTLTVNSNGGNVAIALSGTSGAPPLLQILPMAVDYGQVAAGAASVQTFAVKNIGGTDLTITKSKPPALGQFTATTTLAEGAVITPGQTLTQSVTFGSATAGTFNDIWVITGNDTTGVQNVQFTATAVAALSRTGWVASSSTTGGDPAANAIDGNVATRFSTGVAQVPGQWFQVDMLTAKTFGMIVLDAGGSAGDYPRGYQVLVSNDGVNFGAPVASGTGTTQQITINFATQTARYLRIVQTGTVTPNWWSLHEINVYGTTGTPPQPPQAPSGLVVSGATASALNLAWTASPTSGVTYTVFRSTTAGFTPGAGNQIAAGLTALTYGDTGLAASTTYYYLVQAVNAGGASPSSNQANGTTLAGQTLTALSRTGWVASALPVSAGDTAAKAIDNLPATRFSSGTAQVNGQWFQVDMLTAQSFSRVVMDSTASANDYAHSYQVFVSNDGTNWGTAVATGTGTAAVITVDFAAQSARFVRVVQTSATPANWWSIHELNVYGGGGTPPAPQPASGLTATAASSAAINLSWTASPTSGVTYTVFRSTTSGFTAGAANQIATGVAGVTYTSTGLAASTAYYFLVQANNAGGASASSNQATATTQAAPAPQPPTALAAAATSSTAINVSWTASTTSGVTYTLFRSTTSGFAAGAANQIATGLTGVNYADSGLTPSTTYYYLARANNGAGASVSSNQATATTQAAPTAPQPPTGLVATAATSSGINLSWGASSTSGVTYSVFRSTTSGFTAGAGNQIATGVTGLTYADTGLTASTTYYYLARANNANGASVSSNQANATTQAASGVPTVLPRTGWVASASVTGGADTPAKALDAQGGTRWSSGVAQANGQSFTVDMQTAQTFDRVVMESGADYARAYQIFVSTDGTNWGTAVATGTGANPTLTVTFPVQTKRWVRVVQTSTTPANWWSIYEFNVWNTNSGGLLPYARNTWAVSAAPTSATDTPAMAIDGAAATRWTSGAPQANGHYFQIDMGVAQPFSQIVMDSTASAADYARGYQVFASNDGATWGTAIATGTPTGAVVTVSFASQTKRYIRIVQTGTSTSWWSINEIDVLH